MSETIANTTRAMHHDTARLAHFYNQAIRNLTTGLAGWPTDSTNTNGPSSTDGPMTATERAALTPDPARNQLKTMHEAILKAAKHLQDAAAIAQRWACWQVDGATIQAQLATIETSIWCRNCLRHGDHEPRAQGLDECAECDTLRTTLGRPAPRELINLWRQKGRLFDTDIARWKAQERRDEAERKELQRRKDTARKRQDRGLIKQ